MKNRLLLLFLLCLLLIPCAQAEYWEETPNQHLVCKESRFGCEILQMVMLGYFDSFDSLNRLDVRMFSAAFDSLRTVAQEDLDHFVIAFGTDEDTLVSNYYIALGNCLLADILMGDTGNAQEDAARRVLQLFLNPQGERSAYAQMDAIRAEMNESILQEIAQYAGVPVGFVSRLIGETGAAAPAL